MKYCISITIITVTTLFLFHKRIKLIEDSIEDMKNENDKMKNENMVIHDKMNNMEIIYRDEPDSISCESKSNEEYEIVE